MEKLYMNKYTGSVATMSEWKSDWENRGWDMREETWKSWEDALAEVKKTPEGWTQVEV